MATYHKIYRKKSRKHHATQVENHGAKHGSLVTNHYAATTSFVEKALYSLILRP